VQQGSRKRSSIEVQIGECVGYGQGVLHIGLAGCAHLTLVRLERNRVGPAHEICIGFRRILAEPFN